MKTIAGHVVDVVARQIRKGTLYIDGGKIVNFEASDAVPDQYIIPGFVDAHIHIESSMMLPSESTATTGTPAALQHAHTSR